MKSKGMMNFDGHRNMGNVLNAALLVLTFLFLFRHTLIKLSSDWWMNDNYSHGFLIPLITVYMIWQKKDQLTTISIQPNRFGLFIIMLGMCTFILGNIGAALFISRIAIIITVFGLSFYLLGSRFTIAITIPLAYLAFMIPMPAILWNKVAFPLQLFTASITSHVIQFIGFPLLREGNILYLPSTALEVVDACSGLRSLTSLLALAAAFAYMAKISNISKVLLFLSAIPIAVLINIVRLTSTALLATYIGPETAHGFLHGLSGMIMFVVAFIMLYAVYSALRAIGEMGSHAI